jgi:hypothetical protein
MPEPLLARILDEMAADVTRVTGLADWRAGRVELRDQLGAGLRDDLNRLIASHAPDECRGAAAGIILALQALSSSVRFTLAATPQQVATVVMVADLLLEMAAGPGEQP